MSVIHIKEKDGAARCGCNVYNSYCYDSMGQLMRDEKGKVITERKIMRRYIYSTENEAEATCRRCLNKVNRVATINAPEIPEGKVFHYSFGYDMTINVFAAPIKKTAKGYICKELSASWKGNPYSPNGDATASAGHSFKDDSKTFLMTYKEKSYGLGQQKYSYWVGGGNHWSLVDKNESFYENHCD